MKGYRFYTPRRHQYKPKWVRYPQRRESLIHNERHGTIIHIDRENKQAMVQFFNTVVKHTNDRQIAYRRRDTGEYDMFWNATNTQYFMETWIWNDYIFIELGPESKDNTTYRYFEFDDLRWSSHNGGVGAWITRSYV